MASEAKTVAAGEHSMKRNRFPDVIACERLTMLSVSLNRGSFAVDHNRVRLRDELDDYINANYIRVTESRAFAYLTARRATTTLTSSLSPPKGRSGRPSRCRRLGDIAN